MCAICEQSYINPKLNFALNRPVIEYEILWHSLRHTSDCQCWKEKEIKTHKKTTERHKVSSWIFTSHQAETGSRRRILCNLAKQNIASFGSGLCLRQDNKHTVMVGPHKNNENNEKAETTSVVLGRFSDLVRDIIHSLPLVEKTPLDNRCLSYHTIFTLFLYAITVFHHHHHHQSLNREGRWGTTDDFATSFLHFPPFSTALWDVADSRPVHSVMLSSHFLLCLPCLLPPFTVPWKMVLARPDEWKTWPYHCSLRLFTTVRRSSCGRIACWILARTSSLVTWSLYETCSILR